MAGASGTPTQGNTGSNVFAVPTQMQNQQMGTLLNANPQTTTPITQTATSVNQQQNTNDINNVLAGGKGGGAMQPQKTAMGTPIIYGNTYLPQNQTVANTPAPVVDTNINYGNYDGGGGGGDGGFANGTMSVPGYAYGTASVAGYARGTMGVDDDPWSWTNQQTVAPLSVDIKPSQEQAAPRVADPTQQQLSAMALTKGVDATEKGITAALKSYGTPSSVGAIGTPSALTNVGAMATPLSASAAPVGGLGMNFATVGGAGTGLTAPVTTSLIPTVVGAGGTAAPLGSTLAGLSTGAAVAPVATTAGTAATTTALGTAAGVGGEAALAALGPVGMVIGGALLAKKLGIF
jgi:hypothetical protein